MARACDADWLVFLNNDTRVERTWLAELMAAAARHGADCVASRILDWDGARVDFVGGLLSFIGHSWQRDAGAPVGPAPAEAPLLFACGGSMAIRRDVYVDAGGFDRDFFAYFEDVDLGWRLAVLGYRTVLAPNAVTYHRLHGTAGRIAFAQRLRLYERNALAMIFKNYETATLDRVLPAAIALSLARGLAHSGLDPRAYTLGSSPPPTAQLSARTAVHLLALEDFSRQLPALAAKRTAIQSRRQVADRDLFPLFGEPFRLHDDGHYARIARTLIRDLQIDELFGSATVPPAEDDERQLGTTTVSPGRRASALDDERQSRTTSVSAGRRPSVSIVVLTALGPTHLPECLSSLRAQTHPADSRELIVVDNGSAEDPTPVVQQHYPGARVLRQPRNLGFAAANNLGARAASGEYVAFLNDDTRAHPAWLEELVETAKRRSAVCVASRILSWDGKRIDFAGGSVNFGGKGFQVDTGQAEAGRHTEERPLLFACGGGMLVRRETFLDVGGWDEGTFAYYEDVELGWRLWLLGHDVWFSPRSIVYHKHHGTSDRWAMPPRVRLYERNALRMLYTHLERPTLERALAAALLLAADQVLLSTDLSRVARDAGEVAGDAEAGRRPFSWAEAKAAAKAGLRARGVTRRASVRSNLARLGPRGLVSVALQAGRTLVARTPAVSPRTALRIEQGVASVALDGRTETIPAAAAAAICGIDDFLREIPQLSERRLRFQSARRRTDREILEPFGAHWTSPVPAAHQAAHEEVHRMLIDVFGLDDLVAAPGRP